MNEQDLLIKNRPTPYARELWKVASEFSAEFFQAGKKKNSTGPQNGRETHGPFCILFCKNPACTFMSVYFLINNIA